MNFPSGGIAGAKGQASNRKVKGKPQIQGSSDGVGAEAERWGQVQGSCSESGVLPYPRTLWRTTEGFKLGNDQIEILMRVTINIYRALNQKPDPI